MEAILIELTEEQREALYPILSAMSNGESMIAQVYYDGMRVCVLNAEKSLAVQAAIGKRKPGDQMFASALACHAYAAEEKRHNK